MIENSVRNERAAPYRQIRIFKGTGECPNEKNVGRPGGCTGIFAFVYTKALLAR